jgi:glycosyltransferase involved in cell wall biosynthesis
MEVKRISIGHYNRYGGGGAAIAVKQIIDSIPSLSNNYEFKNNLYTSNTQNDIAKQPNNALNNLISKITKYNYRKQKNALNIQYDRALFEHFGNNELHYKTIPNNADNITHLHWISDFIDFNSFFKELDSEHPIVWTIHDYNPLTGGCHVPFACNKYKNGCYKCPQLNFINKYKDLSYNNYQLKKKILKRFTNLNIVCTSNYMLEKVNKTQIFNHASNKLVIPLTTDLATNLVPKYPKQKDIIQLGFGSSNINRPTKGLNLLMQALSNIKTTKPIVLNLFGEGNLTYNIKNSQLTIKHWNKLDKTELAIFYQNLDYFIFPSLDEAFGQTIIEALAMGTPVIGFKSGAIEDFITNGQNGFICESKNADNLKDKLLSAIEKGTALSKAQIKKDYHKKEFKNNGGKEYGKLYESIINL